MNELAGPPLVDLKVNDNAFVLAGASQIGLLGTHVADARVLDNTFEGEAYGAVAAVSSVRWRIHENDFCDLVIPPSAMPPPE